VVPQVQLVPRVLLVLPGPQETLETLETLVPQALQAHQEIQVTLDPLDPLVPRVLQVPLVLLVQLVRGDQRVPLVQPGKMDKLDLRVLKAILGPHSEPVK